MRYLLALLASILALPALAAVNVFTTVPEWAALVREIGGEKVAVYSATHALQDPHRIEAKPSLLAQARRSQLVVATGADLEIGWLPVVIRDSGNPAIQPGKAGYFEAASVVSRIEIPQVLDRAHGDVHPGGNPHFQLDPYRVQQVGAALSERLALIDPDNAGYYKNSYASFAERWKQSIARWEKLALPLKGQAVLVQHKSFSYLLAWLGMKESAALEPKPGVEPSSGYLSELLARQQSQPARMILRAAYQDDHAGQWMSSRANIPLITLPFTVGGTPEARDLTGLFDDTVARLLKALP